MANGYGALTLADMLRQGVPEDALRTRQEGLADALRTAPARRPPKPFPRELFNQAPDTIPEQYLTDPLFAAAYHAYQGTTPTPSQPGALLQAPPEQIPEEYLSDPAFAQAYHAANKTQPTQPQEPAAQRPWFAGVPMDQIPEEMLTNPDFADAYNAWNGVQPTPSDPEEAGESPEMDASEDEGSENSPLMVQGGPQDTRAPGVYPVEGAPGQVDVVLGGGAGGRMSEDEFYGSPELTAAVRQAMAPQRDAEALAAQPQAPESAPGAVDVAVGRPQIQSRVPAEMPAPAMATAAQTLTRGDGLPTREAPQTPATPAPTGKSNGPASQVADIVKTAAPAVQQAMADNLITPEGLRLLTVLTRDPTLMKIGEIVAGEAASERQAKAKQELARQQREAAQELAKLRAQPRQMSEDEKAFKDRELKARALQAQAAWVAAHRPPAIIAGQDYKQTQADEKALQDLAKGLSTTQGRANLNRENQDLLNRAERLQALIVGPNGDIVNLTPQQVREAGTALANLISKGSMSLTQIEELTPTSMMGKFAQAKQHLLNEPQGAEAQAFLRNMLETAAREKTVIEKQIRRGQAQSLPAFRTLIQRNRPAVDALLRANGLDPSRLGPTGEYQLEGAGQTGARVRIRDTKTGRMGWASEGEKLPAGVEVMR